MFFKIKLTALSFWNWDLQNHFNGVIWPPSVKQKTFKRPYRPFFNKKSYQFKIKSFKKNLLPVHWSALYINVKKFRRLLNIDLKPLYRLYSFINVRFILKKTLWWWRLGNVPLVGVNNLNPNVKNKTYYNIERIRFNPGYIRIWKKMRKQLSVWLCLYFPYNRGLTRYLVRIRPLTLLPSKTWRDFFLKDTLMRFLPLSSDDAVTSLLNKNLIWLNNKPITNGSFLLTTYDYLQVPVNLNYWLQLPFFFFLNNMFIFRRWRNLFFFKKHNFYFKKLKSRKLEKFLTFYKNMPQLKFIYESDVQLGFFFILPSYIPVQQQYQTLSPVSWTMYNWKYIT